MRLISIAVLLAGCSQGPQPGGGGTVILKAGEAEVARYQREKPKDSKLAVESGCFFHPFLSPKGVTVTDLAPDDHRHHRGIFLAWVEMHGAKDADFWGWGEHAPKDRRVIVSRQVSVLPGGGIAARNEWVAEETVLVKEELQMATSARPGANVLDLVYTLTPVADLTLSQWAFSGFCVRVRKEGKVAISDAQGEVRLPSPKHTDPKSDWPAAPWYAYTFQPAPGISAGAAVIDHPKNPPSLWHNMAGIGMLNPCIVAPGKVVLKGGEPLVLRYRVVAYDGEAPRDLLNELAGDWRK